MRIAVFTFLFMGLASQARAFYNPEIAIKTAKSLKNPSVENFLATIPPEFAEKFLVFYGSGSNQFASPDSPRILMFNEEMAMTYNSEHHGVDQVEILHFDPKIQDLVLYDMDFSKNKLHVESNPKSCLGCHTEAFKLDDEKSKKIVKAIWRTMNINPWWAGSYGTGMSAITPIEDQLFNNFKTKQKDSPRYSFLPLEKAVPYTEKDNGQISLTHQNAEFEYVVSKWTAKSIFHRLATRENFKQLRPALLLVLSCMRDDQNIGIPSHCSQPWFKELLKQLTNQQSPDWIAQLMQDRKLIQAAAHAEAKRKHEFISKSLDLPLEQIFEKASARMLNNPAIESLSEVMANLRLIERTFGLKNFVEAMSGNRKADRFELLGPRQPYGLVGILEELLYKSAAEDHPELGLEKLRTKKSFNQARIKRTYSQWTKARDIETIAAKLFEMDRQATNCERITTGALK